MEFIDEGIEEYARQHTEPENDLLKELVRETHAMVLQPRMLSGHLQGRFLSFIAKVYQPTLILEIGTYTGYSALCLAEGLKKDGRLITIDVNEELETFTRSFFDRSSFKNQIDNRIADAVLEIPSREGPIDMVFIDADKRNYNSLQLGYIAGIDLDVFLSRNVSFHLSSVSSYLSQLENFPLFSTYKEKPKQLATSFAVGMKFKF